MNITKLYSQFDYFKQIIKQLYPQVTDLKCDPWCDSVQPIKYYDYSHERTEYPPVVSWRVYGRRHKYVLAPKFKTVYYNDMVSILSGSTTRTKVDYRDQEKLILDLIRYTVEGKTTEEINDILDELRIKNGF